MTIAQTAAWQLSHTRAAIALRAAKNRKRWGEFATSRYVALLGCPLNLYWLACRQENIKNLKVAV